ncbi:MAG: FxsA family protein [Solirubrobacteraceae bacterium]
MLLALLVVVFVVVPLAELYVIIEVGRAIGAFPTIAILVVDSVVGSLLLRSQGRGAWRRLNEALAARRPPAREALDGTLIVFGGAFLITPGFVTDVAGLILLVPATRALVRRALVARLSRRFVVTVAGRPLRGAGRRRPGPPDAYDVEGTAVEVDSPPLER